MDGCNLLWISAPLWDGKEKGDSLTTILICRLLLSDYWTPPPEDEDDERLSRCDAFSQWKTSEMRLKVDVKLPKIRKLQGFGLKWW